MASPKNNLLTQQRLKQLLRYDAMSGNFYWLRSHASVKAGCIAGTKITTRNRYIVIYVDSTPYKAHRLAWLYVYGVWPKGELDHRNGSRADNRIDNLRDATRTINVQNLNGPRRDNKLGILGVSPTGHKFKAQIQANKKKISLGTFDTVEEAQLAYAKAKSKFHVS